MKTIFYLLCGLMAFSTYSMETDTPSLKRQKKEAPLLVEDILQSSSTIPIAKGYTQRAFEDIQHDINSYEGRELYQLLPYQVYLSSKKDNPQFIDMIKSSFLNPHHTVQAYLDTANKTLARFSYHKQSISYRYHIEAERENLIEYYAYLTPLIEAIEGVNWNLATLILQHLRNEDLLIADSKGDTAIDHFNDILHDYASVILAEMNYIKKLQNGLIHNNDTDNSFESQQQATDSIKRLQSPQFQDFITSMLNFGNTLNARYKAFVPENSELDNKLAISESIKHLAIIERLKRAVLNLKG